MHFNLLKTFYFRNLSTCTNEGETFVKYTLLSKMTESRTCSSKLEFEFEDEIKAEDLEVRKKLFFSNDTRYDKYLLMYFLPVS